MAKRRFPLAIVGRALLFAVPMIAFAAYHRHTPTPQEIVQQRLEALHERANTFSHLPSEATILSAEEGDWGEDGQVRFTLPETRAPAEWLGIVWGLNVLNANPMDGRDSYQWHVMGDAGIKFKDLAYDPALREYSYNQVTR